MKPTNQEQWHERAKQVLPAGGYGNYDPGIILKAGRGSRVWDENGKEYIDYLIGSSITLAITCISIPGALELRYSINLGSQLNEL